MKQKWLKVNFREIKKLFELVLLLLLAAFVFYVGRDVSYSEQIKYFEGIRNISGIVFGVSGAWLAIVFPKALSAAELRESDIGDISEKLERGQEDLDMLLGFVRTMLSSVLILAFSIAIPIAKHIVSAFPVLVDYREIMLGVLYVTMVTLVLWQFFILVNTLRISFDALKGIDRALMKLVESKDKKENRKY